MDDDPSLIEHPVARVLLAVIPAALVFLFFVSVLFVPAVQSAAEDGLHSPQDVMTMLDDSAPSMPYGAWLELQLQKPSSLIYENAICAICLDLVDKKDSVRDLPCSHVFHTGCLDSWVSRGHYYCPLCHRLVLQQLLHDAQAGDGDQV